jgi:molybdopterin-binding protein
MKLSACDIVKCEVKQAKHGAVNSEIVLEVTNPAELVSIITKESAEMLGLAQGKTVYAVIKASNVMEGVD